jgi:hypothetical protein
MYRNPLEVIHKRVYKYHNEPKIKHHRVSIPTSLHHVVTIVGSSRVWVEEAVGEVVSRLNAVMWAWMLQDI